jgi:hypothetical protein
VNEPATDRPEVRNYLGALDAALVVLPADEATELREQIRAHLDDALTPEMDEHEVAVVLERLGPPSDLVAEAANPEPPARDSSDSSRRWRLRLPHLSWRRWVAIVIVTALFGSALGYFVALETTPPIQFGGASGWYFPQDYKHQVLSEADGAQQTTVPIRSGQTQGILINVFNPSGWTQTVLGLAPNSVGASGPHAQVALAGAGAFDIAIYGGLTRGPFDWSLPEAIPPHQYRLLRLVWISTDCMSAGSAAGINSVALRVRVGWFTRTETVPLLMGFYVSGPSHGPCT